MKVGIPQLIMLGFIFMDLGISLVKHGEYKKGKYSILSSLFGEAIIFALLYFGGFFN